MDQNLDRHWTAEELPFYEGRCELVDGRIVPLTPPSRLHGRTIMRLSSPLYVWAEATGFGEVYGAETGFLLRRNPDTVRAPDVAAASFGRIRAAADQPYPRYVPEMVAEVLSPSESRRAADRKARMWIGAGVDLVWNVDPARREIGEYRRAAAADADAPPRVLRVGDDLDGGAALPGFRLPVAAIFRPDD